MLGHDMPRGSQSNVVHAPHFVCDVHHAKQGTKQIDRTIDGTDLLNGYAW